MAKDGTSSGTVLVAFTLGALAGAVVALLYAPATGEETRRKISEKAREARERAEAAAREGTEAFRRHRDTVTDAIDRGREVFEQVRKETL
jgi:gas vesicle protein